MQALSGGSGPPHTSTHDMHLTDNAMSNACMADECCCCNAWTCCMHPSIWPVVSDSISGAEHVAPMCSCHLWYACLHSMDLSHRHVQVRHHERLGVPAPLHRGNPEQGVCIWASHQHSRFTDVAVRSVHILILSPVEHECNMHPASCQ